MLLKFMPSNTKIRFMSVRWPAVILSAIMIIGSIALVSVRGLNFGIDFEGGVVIEVETETPADVGRVRAALTPLELGDFQVQEIRDALLDAGEPTRVVMIRTEGATGEGDEVEQAVQATTNAILTALRAEFGTLEVRRSEAVGPKVSGELLQDGVTALVVALGLMLIYIWFRFEWQFSLGAVLALVHDVILTIGMFAVTQFEFNLSTIAALLTIIGYSMNDTVVVYDRVREELRRYKKLSIEKVVDLALNRTLSRTLLTSGTTLLALLSIFILGGDVLRGFSFAMIWGVVIGTYSSVFVASALLMYTGVRRDMDKPAEDGGAAPAEA
ncbi:MAG: protein translocase subunit SecF [Pseudomonadota bacterium]